MKSLRFSFLFSFFLFSASLYAQNLIGRNSGEIRDYMKRNHKNMIINNVVYNNTFKYLKYTDREETQTLLFFLTTDSVCKSVRLVCDKNLKGQKVRELDALYSRVGDNQWKDTKGENRYIIELKEEEWSFNVTIRPNDQESVKWKQQS